MSEIELDSLRPGDPVWRIALLYPLQGSWSVADYLELDGGRLVEYDRGCIDVLDVPTKEHQRIVQFLYRMLFAFVQDRQLGDVFVAPLPVRLWADKFREPDVVFVANGRAEYEGYPDGADLVMEVVSDDETSRHRDLKTKWQEYAQAGIAEYWIVDPGNSRVVMGTLRQNAFEAREFLVGNLI